MIPNQRGLLDQSLTPLWLMSCGRSLCHLKASLLRPAHPRGWQARNRRCPLGIIPFVWVEDGEILMPDTPLVRMSLRSKVVCVVIKWGSLLCVCEIICHCWATSVPFVLPKAGADLYILSCIATDLPLNETGWGLGVVCSSSVDGTGGFLSLVWTISKRFRSLTLCSWMHLPIKRFSEWLIL